MWTHVTNPKFDYALNTTIINAALDYENQLHRFILKFKLTKESFEDKYMKNQMDLSFTKFDLINYPITNKIIKVIDTSSTDTETSPPIVAFRCSKCGYSTINLSLLRLHKQQHFLKTISFNSTNTDFNIDEATLMSNSR
jgi:hypothetical protein